MGIKNDCRRNAEGYSDPTAYEALKNMEQEDERFHKLLDTIFALCELSDFHICLLYTSPSPRDTR